MNRELPVRAVKKMAKNQHVVGLFPPGLREKQDKKARQRKVAVQKIYKPKEEGPARFKVTQDGDDGNIRVFESPDIPSDGRYVLLVKQADSLVLFPLTYKLGFKMTYAGKANAAGLKDEELDQTIKNTLNLMKNKKVVQKAPKKNEKEAADKDGADAAANGKKSKIKDESDDDESKAGKILE